MSLDEIVRLSGAAYDPDRLEQELAEAGIAAGGIVLVHVALSRIGYVVGGAAGVLTALLNVLGRDGTLVMPSQSPTLTDPATWATPAMPPDWVDTIRATMPPYDPARTPTDKIGVVAELFRTWPGVRRSAHPVCSFAAYGPEADRILDPHGLDDPFGEASPLARLYRTRAKILLLGAPWTSCTALHLAERRAWPDAAPMINWSPILSEGRRRVVSWLEYPHDTAPFTWIGRQLEDRAIALVERVGDAAARLMDFADAIDFATERLANMRPAGR